MVNIDLGEEEVVVNESLIRILVTWLNKRMSTGMAMELVSISLFRDLDDRITKDEKGNLVFKENMNDKGDLG